VTQPYLMPINAISATLLHTGKILIVAGSENDADNYSTGGESYRAAVWDPSGTTESSITVHRKHRPQHHARALPGCEATR
jgi:hypothetical protein